jgi:hypothetical protein
MGPSTGYKVEP